MRIVKSLLGRAHLKNEIKGKHILIEIIRDVVEEATNMSELAKLLKRCARHVDEIGGLMKELGIDVRKASVGKEGLLGTNAEGFYVVFSYYTKFDMVNYELIKRIDTSARELIIRKASSEELDAYYSALRKIEEKHGVTLTLNALFTPIVESWGEMPKNSITEALVFMDILRETKKILKMMAERQRAA